MLDEVTRMNFQSDSHRNQCPWKSHQRTLPTEVGNVEHVREAERILVNQGRDPHQNSATSAP